MAQRNGQKAKVLLIEAQILQLTKVFPTEILLETPFDSLKYFGRRKRELLQLVPEKQTFALYIGYILSSFSSEELCGSL